MSFPVELRDGRVHVATAPRRAQGREHQLRRLRQGMDHQVGLVQAKSLFTLIDAEQHPVTDLLANVVEFASRHSDRFGEGIVRLTCVVRLQAFMRPDTCYLGMCDAVRQLAAEGNAGPPRRARDPLNDSDADPATLRSWLAQWVRTPHRDAAERTLLSVIDDTEGPGHSDTHLAEAVFAAAGIRRYADGGHVLDACNKALELADHLGPEHRSQLLPLLAAPLIGARGAEESTPWHHPNEIVALVDACHARLSSVLAEGAATAQTLTTDGPEETALLAALFDDDVQKVIAAVEESLRTGVAPAEVADTVAYAAGVRLARFAPSNEVGDWFNPQDTFIFSNAVAQAVRRSRDPDVVRNIYDAAVAVYLDRYLNVPPAAIPAGTDALSAGSDDGRRLDRAALLRLFDQRSDGLVAAAAVGGILEADEPDWQPADRVATLVDALALATLREDLDFHSLQLLEAAATQTVDRERAADATHATRATQRTARIFAGVVRNLAAHCPTRRAGEQTALIARRLQRGEHICEE